MSDLASGLAATANTTPAPSAPAPTPESSTPSAPVQPSTPQSFADHLRAIEDDPAPAAPEPVAPVGDVPTTEEPQPEIEAAGKEGPIPFTVHKTALENARTKERESVLQQVQAELEPIKPMLPVAQAIAQDVQTGTLDGLNQLLNEYAQHPILGQQLKSMLGRMLNKARTQQQPQAQPDPEPEADLQTADGALVYSAQQLAKREQWLTRQWQRQMEQQIAPFKQLTERVQKAEQIQQQRTEAHSRASQWLEHWSKQPHFTEHKSEIAKAQAEFFQQGHDTQTALGLAYAKVVQEVVLPKLQQQQQQQLVTSAMAKAAGRDANPSAVSANPPSTPRSISEAFQQVGLR
jgi:hypothetical protein